MDYEYTLEVEDRINRFIDESIETAVYEIPTDADYETWLSCLKSIRDDFCFSSRLLLMRYFGKECGITDISIEHARVLKDKEWNSLERFLIDKASKQECTEEEQKKIKYIINKAVFPTKRDKKRLLSREDALLLGHALQFDLIQMEFFLMRVLDSEDGFYYNTSNDLIEAFGFLNNFSAAKVATYKNEYKKQYGNVIKSSFETRNNNATKEVHDSLFGIYIELMSVMDPIKKMEKFMAWIGEKAPYLDTPSKTATRIYRNLAVYAYNLVCERENIPDTDNYEILMENRMTEFREAVGSRILAADYCDETKRELMVHKPLKEAAEQIAHTLLSENKLISNTKAKDLTKPWHVMHIISGGRISVEGPADEKEWDRVIKILQGKITKIQKGDLLYLLWFISNECWSITEGQDITKYAICTRIHDFMELSKLLLDTALLPTFYLPHLTEQSLILSMIYAYHYDHKNILPSEIYEELRTRVRLVN